MAWVWGPTLGLVGLSSAPAFAGEPAPATPPTDASTAPTPSWQAYVGQRFVFSFTDGSQMVATIQRDDGATALVAADDGRSYVVTKAMVVEFRYAEPPPSSSPPVAAPAPMPTAPPSSAGTGGASGAAMPPDAQFAAALKYELSQGESAAEYKDARGMVIGGSLALATGALLIMSGLAFTLASDLSDDPSEPDDPTLRGLGYAGIATFATGFVAAGVGIPVLVVGKRRKADVVRRARAKVSGSPTAGLDGFGLDLRLKF